MYENNLGNQQDETTTFSNQTGTEQPVQNETSFLNNRPSRVRNLEDLYGRILTSYGAGEQFDEVNQHTATGYCDKKEIAFIRQLNSLIRSLEYIENLFDIEGTFKDTKKEMRQRMAFITHSSKSYDGFGVKSVQTQRNITMESLVNHMQEEEEGGILDKIKGAMDKAPKNKRFLPKRNDNVW